MPSPLHARDRTLVIDDDAVMRELLTLLLDAEGRAVLVADSGESAVSMLSAMQPAERPLVLLTDLKMPGLSGGALAERLRVACPRPALLIAMSASKPSTPAARPFDAFLSKPFTIADLDAAVERARLRAAEELDQASMDGGRPAGPSAGNGAAPGGGPPALDEAIYAKLLAMMGAGQMPQLYDMFMDDAERRMDRMESAAGVSDAATFVREAHSIKGGCGMLGASELHSLAGQMEEGGLACSLKLKDFRSALGRLRRILGERATDV